MHHRFLIVIIINHQSTTKIRVANLLVMHTDTHTHKYKQFPVKLAVIVSPITISIRNSTRSTIISRVQSTVRTICQIHTTLNGAIAVRFVRVHYANLLSSSSGELAFKTIVQYRIESLQIFYYNYLTI